MTKVRVKLGKGYDIHVGTGTLEGLGKALIELNLTDKALVIVNTTVDKFYGEKVCRSLARAGFNVACEVIPDGEEYKTLPSAARLFDAAAEARLDRRSPVVALGGGVTGDLAGFVAATYMRGLPFIQVPTTLLAQVDSSIGGKVAVNHAKGKNLIGAFYQPTLVWSDLLTLKTLPYRELLTGMAENIKHAVIADRDLFGFIAAKLPSILAAEEAPLQELVTRSCQVKTNVVEQDETEQGMRAILNFGHTFGHAVENLTGYKRYRHGEAVALGMAAASRMACQLGILSAGDEAEIIALVARAGLPVGGTGLNPTELYSALAYDKKVIAGEINFVLPLSIGKAEVFSGIKQEDVLQAIRTIC